VSPAEFAAHLRTIAASADLAHRKMALLADCLARDLVDTLRRLGGQP